MASSFLLALAVTSISPASRAAMTPLPTAAEIRDRFIAARGGLEKIRAVRTLVLRGPPRPGGRPGRFMARARPYFFLVGDPTTPRDFAEGSDGAPWEYYRDPGLVLRTTDAPARASRHTATFDDPLVASLDPGWRIERLGVDSVAGRPAYRLRATMPDSFQVDLLVDCETSLMVANRKVAPIHAFGRGVETETRIGDWVDVRGALFPTSFREFEIASGRALEDVSGRWVSIEANVDLPPGYFSPPPVPDTPAAHMLNAVFMARGIPAEALGWYRDFRSDPRTSAIDVEAGLEAVAYQCLKNGAVATGVSLLEANLAEHPGSAAAEFGLGRACRAAAREADARRHFRAALALDPGFRRAAEALADSTSR